MATLFTRIIEGEIPCHKIYEDDKHLAFLDIRPMAHGHTLIIPKKETDYLFDMSEEGGDIFIHQQFRIVVQSGRLFRTFSKHISTTRLKMPYRH